MILAGAYYAGWRLSTTPLPLRDRASFLERVAEGLRPRLPEGDPEATTRAVFDVLARHVRAGQLEGRDATAGVSFDEPDVLVVVETLSTPAGVAILEREELDRFPFLGPE